MRRTERIYEQAKNEAAGARVGGWKLAHGFIIAFLYMDYLAVSIERLF